MLAEVIVAHDDPTTLEEICTGLSAAGCTVRSFTDPMQVLDAMDQPGEIDLLVTRFVFPPGKPNGVALARMACLKRPETKVLFVGRPEFAEHAEGLGAFLESSSPPAVLRDTVKRMLGLRTQPLRMATGGVRRSAPMPSSVVAPLPPPAPSAPAPSYRPWFSWRSRFALAAAETAAAETRSLCLSTRAIVTRAVQTQQVSRRLRGCSTS